MLKKIKDLQIRYAAFRLKILTRVCQGMADNIIDRLKAAKSEQEFEMFYNAGINLNFYAITSYNIYLK